MRRLLILVSAVISASCLLPADGIEATVIKGRVVDSAGQPVAGAEVRMWRKTAAANGRSENQPIEVDGISVWRTDGDGHFQTPDVADCGSRLRIVAQAEGMLAGRSGWIPRHEQSTIDARDIVLRRLRTLSGRIVDRNKSPIADATVFNSGDGHQRVEAKTDAAGAFHLPDVPEGPICIFVEHPGYRFAGEALNAGDKPIELVLSRSDDPGDPIRTLSPVLSAREAAELARGVVAPFVDEVVNADDSAKLMAIFALGCVDWQAAVARLDAMSFDDAEEHERVREEIIVDAIRHRRFDDWPEVKALIESAAAPECKAACYSYAARHLFAGDRASGRQLADEALLHARAVSEAKRRALELARIAITRGDLGEREQAEPLAREAFAILDPLPVSHLVSWNATGTVATALARCDLPAARALLNRLHYDHIFAYELGRLACDFALRDVATAEQLWKQSAARPSTTPDDLEWRDRELAAPICYRLAKRDTAAARRVAESLGDAPARSEAFAAVARAMAESDPDAARRLARETLARQPAVGSSGSRWNYTQTESAAICQWLPLLEAIDPLLGREFLWRAVALRPPCPRVGELDDEAEQAELQLIGLLARYDRRLAQMLFERFDSRFDLLVANGSASAGWAVVTSALIDRKLSLGLLNRLPPRKRSESRDAHDWVRLMWVGIVAAPTERLRWEVAGYHDPSRYESW